MTNSLVLLCYGEGGALQTNTVAVCGECSQWMDHMGVCHSTRQHAFLKSKLLKLPGAPWGHSPSWGTHLVHFPGSIAQAPWCSARAQPQAGHLLRESGLRLWHSWHIWATQDSRKMWLVTGSLLLAWQEMRSLGLRLQGLLAFYLWLWCTCLAASREGHK